MSTAIDIYNSSMAQDAIADADASMARQSYLRPKDLATDKSYRFRIIPRTPEDLRAGKTAIFHEFHYHLYDIDPGSKNWAAFACPNRNTRAHGGGLQCGACDQGRTLRAKGRKTPSWDRGLDIAADHLRLVNVIDRDAPEKGVQILELSAPAGKPKGRSMYEKLTKVLSNPQTGGEYLHPVQGFDVILTKSGSGREGTSYEWSLARDMTALDDDMETMMEIIRSQQDLAEVIAAEVVRGVARHAELFPADGSDPLPTVRSRRVSPAPAVGAAPTADEALYGQVVEDEDIPF